MDDDAPQEPSFRSELTRLLNKHGRESESDTPDWVLAQYMEACLLAYDVAIVQRAAAASGPEGDKTGLSFGGEASEAERAQLLSETQTYCPTHGTSWRVSCVYCMRAQVDLKRIEDAKRDRRTDSSPAFSPPTTPEERL